MIKKISVLPFLLAVFSLRAQSIKTDVLVIGNGPSAVAAAIQSARSKVKTVLVAEKIGIAGDEEKLAIKGNLRIFSGAWGEFRAHVMDFYKTTPGFDTNYYAPLRFTRTDGGIILKKMADTVKKLTIELNTSVTAVEKSGDDWDVKVLKDGKIRDLKARVIIDATETGLVAEKATLKKVEKIALRKLDYDPDLGRTAIAISEIWTQQHAQDINSVFGYVPLKTIVVPGVENIIITQFSFSNEKDINALPLQLALGQGAGATAAYCVFFKTTTAHLRVRVIQGELLDYKADLVPFVDISSHDADWRQIQQICASGLLSKGGLFDPDAPVETNGIRPLLTEIYTRAFLWFNKEKPGDKFTIGNMLSFISDYTLTDPAILKAGIQKAWKTQFKFKSAFELNRPVTRREFAVLANKYLNPFARTVDLTGKLVN